MGTQKKILIIFLAGDVVTTKICSKCNVEKDDNDFYNRGDTGRRRGDCKECVKFRAREYAATHKEDVKKRGAAYRSTHKKERSVREIEYRLKNNDKIRVADVVKYSTNPRKKEVKAKYYKEHCDSIKKAGRGRYNTPEGKLRSNIYNKENAAVIRQRCKERYATPEGKLACITRGNRRRSRVSSVKNTLTLKQWNKILVMQNNLCAVCKNKFTETLPPTRDHIIPVLFGGDFSFGNVQALCRSCNSSKGPRVDVGNAISKLLIEV